MLKYTNAQLELLTNANMLLFVEKGIRGGVSQCSNRYSHENNRYMPNVDPRIEESSIMYFDVKYLYGAAMSQHLTIGSFEWEHEPIDVANVPDDAPEGYMKSTWNMPRSFTKHVPSNVLSVPSTTYFHIVNNQN